MRIIDPHVHIWINDPKFPWPAENTSPPTDNRTAEMLLDHMNRYGVEKTVLVQVIHYRWDNSYTAHAMKTYPDRFTGVCRINPHDPAAPDHLSQWVEEHGFQGVRLSPGADPSGDWFKGPLMPFVFQRATDLKIPLLLLTQPGRLPDLSRLLDRFPDLDVCVDHMADAHPDDAEGVQKLLDLARYPRVFVKISHTWSISKQEYPWRDTHDMVHRVYDTFGADRIMWGTDWPVCLGRAVYGQTLAVVRDEMTFFSKDDLEWVLGKTALRLWKFGD
ncbi:MAG: amidohydrolase family protein [candidate division Zixibacteria bacterium]|nr:amidohydrolase family protein [candidate division Zixibacteria bacterium]